VESEAVYRARLKKLIAQVKSLPDTTDPELLSHWSQYLCVLVSGLIEVSVQETFERYATGKSTDHRVAAYVSTQVDRALWSANLEKITKLAKQFDEAWGRRVGLMGSSEKAAIESVYANRNSIAHGEPVPLTFSQVEDYFDRACRALDHIAASCS
jgi:hypothetical protein